MDGKITRYKIMQKKNKVLHTSLINSDDLFKRQQNTVCVCVCVHAVCCTVGREFAEAPCKPQLCKHAHCNQATAQKHIVNIHLTIHFH